MKSRLTSGTPALVNVVFTELESVQMMITSASSCAASTICVCIVGKPVHVITSACISSHCAIVLTGKAGGVDIALEFDELKSYPPDWRSWISSGENPFGKIFSVSC